MDKKGTESRSGIFCRLIHREVAGDASSVDHRNSSNSLLEKQVDDSFEKIAYSTTTKGDALMSSGEYESDQSSLLSLQPWIFRKARCRNAGENLMLSGVCSDKCGYNSNKLTDSSQAELSPRSVSLGYGLGRGRSSLRSRRPHRCSVKPLTSVENCLIPQLYNEHFEIEESASNSVPYSTVPAVRPLIITDGSRIISKSPHDPLSVPFQCGLREEVAGVNTGLKETVVSVPRPPPLKVPKLQGKEEQRQKMDVSNSQRPCQKAHLQDSADRMLLFCLGINIGVISTVISNRREVDKLNNMLKHTENLVQDLQEELEMKESLTVKELANEACESQELTESYANMEGSTASLNAQGPVSYSGNEANEYDQLHLAKSVDNSELSKIEAELEAELERLELNMNATSLEGRMSALGELDPDLMSNLVHGELRADALHDGAQEGQVDANRDSNSSTPTDTHNTNYAVSPRELSLRLHEVIQSQMEERIEELERALKHSQKQLQLMEADQVLSLSQKDFSNSDMGSSSNQNSPTTMEEDHALAQPLCLNLAGDALNAYDEAYEEFMRINDTQEMPPTTDTGKKVYGNGFLSSERSLIWGMEGSSEEKSSTDTRCFERDRSWEQMLRSRESNDVGESSDSGDSDDERKLIQQIVEKTRKGSPVVIHAQRMFFSMDD